MLRPRPSEDVERAIRINRGSASNASPDSMPASLRRKLLSASAHSPFAFDSANEHRSSVSVSLREKRTKFSKCRCQRCPLGLARRRLPSVPRPCALRALNLVPNEKNNRAPDPRSPSTGDASTEPSAGAMSWPKRSPRVGTGASPRSPAPLRPRCDACWRDDPGIEFRKFHSVSAA